MRRRRRTGQHPGPYQFPARVVIVCLAGIALYILWRASGVLMLIFGAILIATLLSGLAQLIKAKLGLSGPVALLVSLSIPIVVLGGAGAVFGPRIWAQVRQVVERAPAAVNELGSRIGFPDAYGQVTAALENASSGRFFSQVAGYGFSFIGGAADLLIVIAAGVYLAAQPHNYREGLVSLFPEPHRNRLRETLSTMALTLRHWFIGQLASMLLVGTLSGLAFVWIGLPTPIGLAVIAGITNFVPIIGPWLGAVPALLLASTQSASDVLWTGAAMLIIQQLDGNVVMPIVQNRAVNLPPAVTLLSILVSGAVFGTLGVIFAAPIAVACMVTLEKLWIQPGCDSSRAD